MHWHEWRHIVGFEETSLVGTVYFANYVVWQGSCRESFIHSCAPDVTGVLMSGDLALITKSCACEFMGMRGLYALEDVLVKMAITRFRGGRCTLGFLYYNCSNGMDLIASGEQEVHSYHKSNGVMAPAMFPDKMLAAFPTAAATPEIILAIEDAKSFSEKAKIGSVAQS